MLVGHSTGGGEVARYIGRHGTSRLAKAVLVGAIPPLMLKTAANPGGLPIEVFDQLRAGLSADRSQFYKDLSAPFFAAAVCGSLLARAFFGVEGNLAATMPPPGLSWHAGKVVECGTPVSAVADRSPAFFGAARKNM